jgi:hypothetical protein
VITPAVSLYSDDRYSTENSDYMKPGKIPPIPYKGIRIIKTRNFSQGLRAAENRRE